MTQIREFYVCIQQDDWPEVILTHKDNALIAGFTGVVFTSYHILCIWYINKNVTPCSAKFFKNSDQVKT